MFLFRRNLSKSRQNPLTLLPVDIWHLICNYCDIGTIITLRSVAKFFGQHYTRTRILQLVADRLDLIFTCVALNDLNEVILSIMLRGYFEKDEIYEKHKREPFACSKVVFKTHEYDVEVPGLESISLFQVVDLAIQICKKLDKPTKMESNCYLSNSILTFSLAW